MKIIIKETSEIRDLSIIDPKTGCDFIADFIGNMGAFTDGQFDYDDNFDVYICDKDTFDWWDTVVTENQNLEDRIYELSQKHGLDSVYKVVNEARTVDLENHAASVNQALDEAFLN